MNLNWVRRTVVVVAMGGMAFQFGIGLGGGDLVCGAARNALLVPYLTNVGDGAIETVSDGVFGNIGTDFDTIVREPTTDLVQDLWGNWVQLTWPLDPAYQNLLAE